MQCVVDQARRICIWPIARTAWWIEKLCAAT